MVNLDSLGLSSTKVEVDRSDRQLVGLLNGVAQTMGFALSGANVGRIGYSDAACFAGQHIPAITVHSVTQDTLTILHSSRDTDAALKLDDYYETYRLLIFYLAFLDVRLR
jgi:Iap family predicted aminopeptidase